MKYYENCIKLRRLQLGEDGLGNGYHIHAKLESLIVNDCNVKTPYVFNVTLENEKSQSSVFCRTCEPTKLPGEKEKLISFEKGQSVTFTVRVLPYLNKTVKPGERRKRLFIDDSVGRELKLLSMLERAGLDAESCEELDQKVTRFVKPKNAQFSLTSVNFLVEAKVVDPSVFEKAYIEGIGPKANFGYGMILLVEGSL